MIQKLAATIKTGTKFFINHGKGTNSHTDRESVGEIVASYSSMVDDKLSNIVIGHFPNKEAVKDLDVCSIEAEIYTDNADIVGDVEEVSAVALGNSSKEHPAFPGAMRLGAVQCFEKTNLGDKEIEEMADKITFDMVKTAVREMNIRPNQIFNESDLKDDKEFGKFFTTNDQLSTENERLKTENEAIKTENQESVKKANVATAKTRLDEKMKEGYTDKQRAFITERFKPEKLEDVSDKALDVFLEEAKSSFASSAKIFGVTEKGNESTNTTKKDSSEEGASDKELEDDFDKALNEIGVI